MSDEALSRYCQGMRSHSRTYPFIHQCSSSIISSLSFQYTSTLCLCTELTISYERDALPLHHNFSSHSIPSVKVLLTLTFIVTYMSGLTFTFTSISTLLHCSPGFSILLVCLLSHSRAPEIIHSVEHKNLGTCNPLLSPSVYLTRQLHEGRAIMSQHEHIDLTLEDEDDDLTSLLYRRESQLVENEMEVQTYGQHARFEGKF